MTTRTEPAAGLSSARVPKLYLSGPMRGYPNFNFPAFDLAAELGRREGFEVISPADLDRASGFTETSTVTPANLRVFVERDVQALLNLRAENGDAVAVLPGWERSTGALAEVMVARWLGLRVISALS